MARSVTRILGSRYNTTFLFLSSRLYSTIRVPRQDLSGLSNQLSQATWLWSPSLGAMKEKYDAGINLWYTIPLRLMMTLMVAVINPAVDYPYNAGINDSSSCWRWQRSLYLLMMSCGIIYRCGVLYPNCISYNIVWFIYLSPCFCRLWCGNETLWNQSRIRTDSENIIAVTSMMLILIIRVSSWSRSCHDVVTLLYALLDSWIALYGFGRISVPNIPAIVH